jgi:hypothetical protein
MSELRTLAQAGDPEAQAVLVDLLGPAADKGDEQAIAELRILGSIVGNWRALRAYVHHGGSEALGEIWKLAASHGFGAVAGMGPALMRDAKRGNQASLAALRVLAEIDESVGRGWLLEALHGLAKNGDSAASYELVARARAGQADAERAWNAIKKEKRQALRLEERELELERKLKLIGLKPSSDEPEVGTDALD